MRRPETAREGRGEPPGETSRGVLLVSMPFMDPRFPLLGLSLLKPLLIRDGIPCDVRYLCFPFQAGGGKDLDAYTGHRMPWLLGEWPFAEALYRGEGLQAPPLPDRDLGIPAERLHRIRAQAGPFLRWCLREVPWERYAVVGFTVRYYQQTASLALARMIKARSPGTIVALGGPCCHGEMGRALLEHFPFVDWVFSGEADLSFPEAVKRHLRGLDLGGIAGAAYRSGGTVVVQGTGERPDLDALPCPDHSDFLRDLAAWCPQWSGEARLSVEFSRGCWWAEHSKCLFCSVNKQDLRSTVKSPRKAVAELRALTENSPVKAVLVVDSVLAPRTCRRLMPLLEEVESLESLQLEARATLSPKDWLTLKDARVTAVQLGIESLDTGILRLMRKGTTLLQNVLALKRARELGIAVAWNFLYGIPGEEPEAYSRMARLMPALAHLHPPLTTGVVILQRFSPMFEERGRLGFRRVRASGDYALVHPLPPAALDELAYAFDFDFDGKEAVRAYVEPALTELAAWSRAWNGPRYPLLASRPTGEGEVEIFDTRPCRTALRTRLEGLAAAVYGACREGRSFASLRRTLGSRPGPGRPGDAAVHACLQDLVDRRLMLEDGTSYLALANDLASMMASGGSTTALLLDWLSKTRFLQNTLACP